MCLTSEQVVFSQIPRKKLPFKGRTLVTTKFLLPVIEKLLDMPDAGLEEGSDEWIKSMKENLDMVTFTHMNRYT